MLRSHCIYMDAPRIVMGGNEFNNIIYFELSQLSSRCPWFHTSPFLPDLSDEAAEVKVCCRFRIKGTVLPAAVCLILDRHQVIVCDRYHIQPRSHSQ